MDDQLVDAGGQETPVRDASLNGVQGRVTRRRIAEEEFTREIRTKPRRRIVRPNFRNTFLGPEQPVTLQTTEAATVKKNPAIQIAFRLERQAEGFQRGIAGNGDGFGISMLKAAETAKMVHVVIRSEEHTSEL